MYTNLAHEKYRVYIFKWGVIAFIVRCFVGLLIHAYSIKSGFNGFYPLASGGDDSFYHTLASSMDPEYVHRVFSNLYPEMLSVLYRIVGCDLGFLVGKMLNILLGSVTVVYVGLITLKVMEYDQEHYIWDALSTVLPLATFYPAHLFYCTQLLKDAGTVFIGVYSLYLLLIITHSKRIQMVAVFKLIIAVLIFSRMRLYGTLALILAYLIYMLVASNTSRGERILFKAMVVLAIGLTLINSEIQNFIHSISSWNLSAIKTFRETAYSTGGSTANIELKYNTPIEFIISYGYSLITVIFGPLPWQIKSITHLIALPEGIYTWCMMNAIVSSFVKVFIKNVKSRLSLVTLYGFVSLGLVALFSDNIGANTRIRMTGMIMLLITISVRSSYKSAARST